MRFSETFAALGRAVQEERPGLLAQELLHDFHSISTHLSLHWVPDLPSYDRSTQPWGFLLCCLICHDMLSDLGRAEPFTEETLKRRQMPPAVREPLRTMHLDRGVMQRKHLPSLSPSLLTSLVSDNGTHLFIYFVETLMSRDCVNPSWIPSRNSLNSSFLICTAPQIHTQTQPFRYPGLDPT